MNGNKITNRYSLFEKKTDVSNIDMNDNDSDNINMNMNDNDNDNDNDGGNEHHRQHQSQSQRERQRQTPALIPQPRPQPTMKEKLVERERQRRVESERARWKRQFAMAAHAELEQDEEDNYNNSNGNNNNNNNNSHGSSRDNNNININADNTNGNTILAAGEVVADFDRSFAIGPNSVAGTVGEDTVAPIETLEEDNNDSIMNYPMERFLKEQQGNGINMEETMSNIDIGGNINGNENNRLLLGKNKKETTSQVVMERFLQEQQPAAATSVSVPEHMNDSHPSDHDIGATASNDDGATNHHLHHHHHHHNNPFRHPSESEEQPRVVLRLTEAEIQEMAAIDDASRSNAPPSEYERDDISELGELVSDFGLVHLDNQNMSIMSMSQGTPVTAMESVTSSVGGGNGNENENENGNNQIGQIMVLNASSSDHGGVDGIEGHSVFSNIVASSAGGDVSLTGNPPSDIVTDDDNGSDNDSDNDNAVVVGRIRSRSPRSPQVPTEILPTTATVDVDVVSIPIFTASRSPVDVDVDVADATVSTNDPDPPLEMIAADETIINRTMRPGMYNYKQQQQQQQQQQQ